MKKRTLMIVMIIAGCIVSLILFFVPFYTAYKTYERDNPGVSLYGFPTNPFNDYYHYTYFLKSGLQGKLNFENVYTDSPQPFQFLEPHYNLVGFLFRPFPFSQFDLFNMLRIFSIASLIICVVWLIQQSIEEIWGQLLALIFVIFSTSYWWFGKAEIQLYSNMFDVAKKILTLPPHYLFSTCITIALLIHATKLNRSAKSYAISIFLIMNLGIMHPYVAVCTLLYLFLGTGITFIIKKRFDRTTIHHFILMGIFLLPFLEYYKYMLDQVWRSEVLKTYPIRSVTLMNYLLAIGPVFFAALPACFHPETWRHPLRRLLVLWGVVPILLVLSNDIGIPMSQFRMYQTFQQIPFAILSVLSIMYLFKYVPKFFHIPATLLLGFCMILYAYPPYNKAVQYYTDISLPYYRAFDQIRQAQGVITYLNNHSKEKSVVIAPEMISAFIPSFTSNAVIIGHEGPNPNYKKNMSDVSQLYFRTYTRGELQKFLSYYRVSYVLFGLESDIWENMPYKDWGLLESVYTNGRVTLVKVKI